MEEHTNITSVLTVDQCQCLIQIWEKITYALIFTGQDTTLYQALRGARSVLNSDQATVNNARNQLARIFANLTTAEIEQLTLSHLTTAISRARTRITTTNPRNIDTGYPNVDHGRNTDLSAGTDGLHTTSVGHTNLLLRSDRPVYTCDGSEECTVMGQHSSFAEPEKLMLSFTRNHSPYSHCSSVSLQTLTNQQDQSGIIHKSKELQRVSVLNTLRNGGQNQEKEEEGDRGKPHQDQDRVAPMAMAISSGGTNMTNKEGRSPRPAKRQRSSLYAQSDEDSSPRPAKRQKLDPPCKGPTARKCKYLLQQSFGGPPRPSRRPKPQWRSSKSHSSLDKETEVAVGPICLQPGMRTTSSPPENQHQTRRGGDQSSGTSIDGRLASTARITPAAESAPLTDPTVAAHVVDTNLEWEVSDILGKKVVDGEVQYLVDWRPTLVPEHALGNAKELVDEFEARVRPQCE